MPEPDHHRNKVRIKAVANALGDLLPQTLFVGGSVIGFYLPSIREADVRPTEDVDIVINLVVSYTDHNRLNELLLNSGFKLDVKSSINCRYIVQGITVDVMVPEDSAFGVSNRWYKPGMAASIWLELDNISIQILPIRYLLATKVEALKGRGGQDYRQSPDMEDICSLLAFGKQQLWEKPLDDGSLTGYLAREAQVLLERPNLTEEVGAHFRSSDKKAATDKIYSRLKQITNADGGR